MFQPTVKNFKMNFNVVNDRNTFSSVDIITGHISFDLAKETKITSITMALKVRASVHWSTDVGGGGRRRRRIHYSAKLDFFNFKSAIVQENSDMHSLRPFGYIENNQSLSLVCLSLAATGETVKIYCDFSNASYRTATPKVRLQQKQGFYIHNKAHKRMIFKNFASVTGQLIIAHTSDVHTEIMLTIPSSASLTISNCSILEVVYFIEVGTNDRLMA